MLVRSFLVGVMVSSGTTSGIEDLVGSLTLALAAQSASVEGRQAGACSGSSLSVSSEIGFVLGASGVASFFFFSFSSCAKFFLASSLNVISVDNLLTRSMFSFTLCST